MDFELSHEQREFQKAAREFTEKEIAPYAKEWDEKHIFPVDTLRKAAALGMASIYVRSDVGGSELNRLAAAIIFEELAAAFPSTAASLSIHNMVSWLIDQYGNDTLRKHW